MNFDFAKVFPEFQLLLWRDLLITEEHNRSLSNQQSELILLLVSELSELNTF